MFLHPKNQQCFERLVLTLLLERVDQINLKCLLPNGRAKLDCIESIFDLHTDFYWLVPIPLKID